MRMSFVILHYRTAEDTIECISSILNLNEPSQIIVVDNASENGSIEKVEYFYKDVENISIIKNKSNLGFAEGNNVGYQYARNALKSGMIAILNNDILIETRDFIEKVFELYDRTLFYVAGPDIKSLADHHHQNPMRETEASIKAVNKEILRYRALYCVSLLNIYDLLKGKGRKSDTSNTLNLEYQAELEGVILHGAFMIFSKNYIKKEIYAFRPGTFLYMEESILHKYCKQKGYKMVYSPSIKVYHKEDSSTNSLFNAKKNKREFIFKNMIRSLKIYKAILKELVNDE